MEQKFVSEETFTNLVNAVDEYNKVINGKDAVAINKAAEKVDEAKKLHNKHLIKVALDAALAEEKPMLAALKKGYIKQIKVKVNTDSVTGLKSVTTEDGNPVVVPLQELERNYTKGGMLCNNGQWPYMAEKFAMLMNARAAEECNCDTKRFALYYRIQEKANDCDIGAKLTSNTQIAKALQTIVDAIITDGEKQYKVLSCDVKWILYCLVNEGKKNSIVCCKPDKMIRLITKVLHRIVTDGTYEAEYKEKKVV